MVWHLLSVPFVNMAESIYDGCRDKVVPVPGSVLYCDLAMGYMEHSGIYVGDGKIVHLSGEGAIEVVSPKQFIKGGTAINIYVSCKDEFAVGSPAVARRAKSKVGYVREYNFLMDNCHQFSAGCLTGAFDKHINFLWMLKDEAKINLGSNTWRHWDIELFN